MLTKMKNSALLSLLVAMMIMLAACGTATNEKAATPTASPAQETVAPTATPTEAPAETVELTISAAASLTEALEEISKLYTAEHANIKLSFNFAASGALQQQIEQGAPADLFLSAAPKNMNALVEKGLVEESKQVNLLNNELVAVVPTEGAVEITAIADLSKAEVKKVAVGIPDSVPAGKYAQEALTAAGLWDSLQAKTVQAKDVKQVLQYVETGNAEVGFVYKTDALSSDKATIAFAVDPATYSPIHYPIGIVKATKHNAEAEELYAYLQTKEALDIFVKYGFSIPG
jgi:molybdate transport system substrate-binding protein